MADNYFRFRYGEVAGDGTSRAEIERQELMKHQREAERREVAERQRQIEATKNQIEQARQLELARQMKQTERIVHPRNERTGGAENDRTVGPKVLQIDTEQWRKYHTAWTNYYNDYYKNYYAKQANEMAASRVSANQARALPAGAVDVKRSNDNAGETMSFGR